MWNPNIKAINITKLVQMLFNTWFGYFEYVGYNIDFFSSNVSTLWLSTLPDSPDHGASSSEKSPAQNFSNHFWHIQSVIAPFSIHCTNLLLCFSCIFTFLKIIKHNTPKNDAHFLPSSILKSLDKISLILVSF